MHVCVLSCTVGIQITIKCFHVLELTLCDSYEREYLIFVLTLCEVYLLSMDSKSTVFILTVCQDRH